MVNAAKFFDAQALVIGGDVTGKLIVPFVANPDGTWRSEWARKEHLKTPEVERMEEALHLGGQYTLRLSPGEMAELTAKPDALYEKFNELMAERLRSWLELAEERLHGSGTRLYIIPGNDDRFEVDPLCRDSTSVVFCENRRVELGALEMVSCGWTNPTPWHTTRELPEEELRGRLAQAADRASNLERAIFNFHCPPTGTSLDFAPVLTPDLKVVTSGGGVQLQHVGSQAVRELIAERQPLLSLHGHIHESRSVDHVGRTICFNPGSEYTEGVLDGVILDFDGPRVLRHQFTAG